MTSLLPAHCLHRHHHHQAQTVHFILAESCSCTLCHLHQQDNHRQREKINDPPPHICGSSVAPMNDEGFGGFHES